MSLPATLYIRPDGRTQEIEISKIRPEDEAWFKERDYAVSLEDCNQFFTIYVDYGVKDVEGEPLEYVYPARTDETCEEAFATIREKLTKITEEPDQ